MSLCRFYARPQRPRGNDTARICRNGKDHACQCRGEGYGGDETENHTHGTDRKGGKGVRIERLAARIHHTPTYLQTEDHDRHGFPFHPQCQPRHRHLVYR